MFIAAKSLPGIIEYIKMNIKFSIKDQQLCCSFFYCAKCVSSKIAVELHMKRKEKENSINETRFYYTLPSQYYAHEFRFILAHSSSISSGSWWIQLIALFTMRSTEVPRYK